MGRWNRLLFASVLAVSATTSTTAHAGKLQSVRSEVRESGGSSSSSGSGSSSGSSSSSSSSSSSDDSSECCVYSNGNGAGNGNFDVSWDHVPKYSRFPYRDGYNGYIQTHDEQDKGVPSRMVGGTVQAEAGYLYDKLYRGGFAFDLNYWRVGVKSDLSFLVEGPLKDAMYLGSSNGVVSLGMLPRMRFRVGGGAQYMIDGRTPGEGHREYAAGGNLTTDLDVFPFWPLVVSGRFDYGWLYKAPSIMTRGTLGFVIEGFELYGGYTYRKIGDVQLHGPTAGLRVWF